MTHSRLQEPFLRTLAEAFVATKASILNRLKHAPREAAEGVIEDELRGLYHGVLVVLDGGSSLAEHGMLRIVDDDGEVFDSFLHEICFQYWQTNTREAE
jgi:hypothetical protein